MDDKKKSELAEDQLDKVSGGCDDHDPKHDAAQPPCIRCAYKYMVHGNTCPCCGAIWQEQIGGF